VLLVGSVLSGGGSVPKPQASAEDWMNMVNDLQKGSLSTRLGIPMIYGIDAVHGNNNVYNATIFPHNVGLGATRYILLFLIALYVFSLSNKIIFKIIFVYHDEIYLSSNRDPKLVRRIGAATALEIRATGVQYAFAPCIAVTNTFLLNNSIINI